MKIIIKEPGKEPHQMIIDNSLKTLQELVDGYIEPVRVNEGIVMIVNEEGKLRGMEKNFAFRGDTIVGNAIFVGDEGEDFTDVPATAEDIKKLISEEYNVGYSDGYDQGCMDMLDEPFGWEAP